MDHLLKEFELLSLPSRVNLESLSDDCIDKLLENVDLVKVFEALKVKGDSATSFQWRKLREACLISKSSSRKTEFIIEVYEEAFKFNLRKGEMAECHISISKLIEFYCEGNFDIQILGLILLFRFYYTEEVDEGFAEVAALLRNKVPFEILNNEHIQSILRICILASEGNHLIIKESSDYLQELEQLLIERICERSKKLFIGHVLKAYPLVSVHWVKKLFNSDDSEGAQEMIKKVTGQLIELNEGGDKFIFKKRK